MSSSAITTQVAQLKIGNVQNQADTSAVYSAGVWSFKNSTALTSVTITDAGNVGVGTASLTAGYRMTVNGSISMPVSEAPLSWTGNGIVEASSSLYLRSTGAANVLFQTNNTERMRIDASGKILVNTGNTTAMFNIFAPANTVGWWQNKSSTGAYDHMAMYTDGVLYAKMTNTGGWQNSGGVYGSLSDVKLKENIIDATPKLADICKVRVVNYNLKTQPELKQLGVIAQELEQIFPSLIEEAKDLDAEGKELGTTTKAVKYSIFVPMLIKAMQEQQAIIEKLEARLAASDTRLAALEAK